MKGRAAPAEAEPSLRHREIQEAGITQLEDEFALDHLPFIDYGLKEDTIFGNLDIDGEEAMNELDITKIYENELELSENELEKVNAFGRDFTFQSPRPGSTIFGPAGGLDGKTQLPLNVDLNSDVGNDICWENIKKIHQYLEEDAQTERALEAELNKAVEFMKLAE